MKKNVNSAIYIFLMVVFLPVLGTVIFVGNKMDYFEAMKIADLLSNQVLAIIALIGAGICGYLIWSCRKMKLTFKNNLIVNCVFVALFVLLYFVNIRVAKEIVFELPWDIMVVRGIAYKIAHKQMLEYYYYLSIYPNNIPISYILGRIFRSAEEMGKDAYMAQFVWVQINCMLISVGGFFSCIIVKKVTKQLMPALAAFCLYLILVGISAWKIAPYTDTYGIVFPVMSIYFYFCYRDANKRFLKYLYIILVFVASGVGGFIKPSIYLLFIAVLGIEFIRLLTERGENWKFFLVGILATVALLFTAKVYTNSIIDEIGLEYNAEMEADWHHYFYMGLNEDTTGGYNSDDTAVFGEFQTSKSERRQVQLERAFSRMKERGVGGSLYFWLRKMVMTFNDGTFGWDSEVWVYAYFPEDFASNTFLTKWLRDIYWGGPYTGRYNTLCQLAWIFCMICIPGICVYRKEETAILAVSFLGIFLYQMLFEARARYLFVFLPLLIAIAMCGLWQYAVFVGNFCRNKSSNLKGCGKFINCLKNRHEKRA